MGFQFERKEHIDQVIARSRRDLHGAGRAARLHQGPRRSHDDKGRTPANYQVTKKLLFEKAKPNAIVLHSLPRQDELTTDVDNTRFQRYWVEAYNGVLMRMALLALILGAVE